VAGAILICRASAQERPSGETIRAELKDKHVKIRILAAKELDKYDIPSDPEMVDAVKAALKDESAEVRRLAAHSAYKLRNTKFAKDFVSPLLLLAEKDKDPKVRERALNSLACLEAEAKEVVGPLIKMLGSEKDAEIREGIVTMLPQVAPADKNVITALAKSLKDSGPRVRLFSAIGLRDAIRLGHHKEIAVPALIEALKDETWPVRREAATGLGDAGGAGRPALKTLEKLAKEAPDEVPTRAAFQRAIEQIREAIKDDQ
jgi:HEAT repeat protein